MVLFFEKKNARPRFSSDSFYFNRLFGVFVIYSQANLESKLDKAMENA